MSHFIIHHNGAYNVWSTVVDAPCFESALTLGLLTELTRQEQGEEGVNRLPSRLERAHQTGCSGVGETLDGCIAVNRAGNHEANLPKDEFIRRYLTL